MDARVDYWARRTFAPLLGSIKIFRRTAMPQDPEKSLVNDHQKAVISQGVAKNAEIPS
jgi:hypothetical protein